MKHTKNILGTMLLTAMFVAATSCVDDSKLLFAVEKPASIAGREYLNEYDVLKSYVNSSANPDFKLGIALAANDYINGGVVTRLANSNFHEMTAGNAMKYASCVADNGTMNFETVDKFVTAARAGGITIYGHTLAWHAQQNNKYLNSLIKDKEIEVDPNEADNALHINTPGAKENAWDWEIYYNLSIPLTKGVEYTIGMRAKASTATEVLFWPGDGTNTQYLPSFSAGAQWGETSVTFTADYDLTIMRFCFGTFGGDLYFDDLFLKATGSDENLIANPSFDEPTLANWSKPGWHDYTYVIEGMATGPTSWWTDMLTNGNAEGNDVSCFYATEQGLGGPNPATIGAVGTGADGVGRAFVVQSGNNPEFTHSTQFFVKVPRMLEEGDKYRFTMKYRADKAANSESQSHNNPGGYIHWQMLSPNPSFTTEWQEKTWTGTISSTQAGAAGMNTIAFNLAVLGEANMYYFDDIMFEIEESGNTMPLTPEEKKEILTKAMGDWVKGMMKACDGYVTAWDVVNEAISGRDAGDGYYGLQSATRGTVSEEDARNNFYWQDYLGDLDYVRTTIKFAREYYAETGGNPTALKLFINDYNLESDWDDNKKMKSMAKWIERWEEDGVTKIDGIGTQMHVSYYANAETQKSKEDHVVQMYELMAATGKLIKISELDMGYVDENGKSVKAADMTEEQHKAMAEYYKFIVKKYFEIIPAAQQYGITQWCITDSPNDSGWRAGEPVGLWDLNYNRKPAYAGFADGLAGK